MAAPTSYVMMTTYLSSNVNAGGTITIALPAGVAAAAVRGPGALLSVPGNNARFPGLTATIGGGNATVTYPVGSTPLPAGTKVTIQLELLGSFSLTDNTAGTVSGTLAALPTAADIAAFNSNVLPLLRNAFASLAATVNGLKAELDSVRSI